jgi:hypothetical protein
MGIETNEYLIKSNQVLETIRDHKNKSNKDLLLALEFIKKEFDLTKENLLKLTNHIDKLELTYNILLKEYEERNGTTK